MLAINWLLTILLNGLDLEETRPEKRRRNRELADGTQADVPIVPRAAHAPAVTELSLDLLWLMRSGSIGQRCACRSRQRGGWG